MNLHKYNDYEKYSENKCVLRHDLNDSTDLALRTFEGSAFQRTGFIYSLLNNYVNLCVNSGFWF